MIPWNMIERVRRAKLRHRNNWYETILYQVDNNLELPLLTDNSFGGEITVDK